MVSFIIPVYNTENYIDRCLESILRQTNNDYEVIIINDGSKDKSEEKCLGYSNLNDNVLLFSQENQGVSNARERGREEAKGEWIVYVDSDDYINENYCNYILKNGSNYDYIILSKNFETDKEMSEADKDDIIMTTMGIKNGKYRNCRGNAVTSKAYRKQFLMENNIKFMTDILHGEDLLYNLSILSCNPKTLLAKEEVYYLQNNPNSVTHKYQPHLLENELLFYEKLRQIIEKYRDNKLLLELYNLSIINSLWLILCQYLYHKNNTMKKKERRQNIKEIVKKEIYMGAYLSIKFTNMSKYKSLIVRLFLEQKYCTAEILLKLRTLTKVFKKCTRSAPKISSI